MASFKLSKNAKLDIARIWSWGTQKFGESQADKYLDELYEQFEKIASNPLIFSEINELSKGYRRCPFKFDSIYYKIQNNEVQIMAVIGKQDMNLWV